MTKIHKAVAYFNIAAFSNNLLLKPLSDCRDMTGDMQHSPQIGADSHKLLAEILVKVFAQVYHDITMIFSAYLHENSTTLFEFFLHLKPSYDSSTLLQVCTSL